jgi:phosphatidylserine/phosphatidylglycerophosphate/cardiolipin synthase-like enzyme
LADSNDRKVVIVGSANATSGGLSRNFETSLEVEVEPLVDDELLEDLNFLWVSYSSPLPPLTVANLLEIDRNIIQRVGHDQPPTDARPRQPHPLRQLIPPHGVRLRGVVADGVADAWQDLERQSAGTSANY